MLTVSDYPKNLSFNFLVDKTERCRVLEKRPDLSAIKPARRFSIDLQLETNVCAWKRGELLDNRLYDLVNLLRRSVGGDHDRTLEARWQPFFIGDTD